MGRRRGPRPGALPAPLNASAVAVAVSVNDRDEVVGDSQDSLGNRHAFLWRHGRMTDLGTLGGPYSSARAINDLGDVVGYAATSRVVGSKHGLPIYAADVFLWHDGRMRDLGSLPGGENSGSIAFDINDLGQIAGAVSDAQAGHAATWRNGRWTVLDPLAPGDQLEAIAINDRGQVAGNDATREIAVLWAVGAPEDVTASGRCPGLGPSDLAFDVNDLGWLPAWAPDPGRPTGFGGFYRNPVICRGGTLQFLPAPPSAGSVAPSRMNKLGAIVGTADLLDASGSFAASPALLWSPAVAHQQVGSCDLDGTKCG